MWFEALQQPCNNPATTSLQGRCRVVSRSLQGRYRVFAGSSKTIKNHRFLMILGPCKGPATTLQRPCNGPATTPLQGRCKVVVGSLHGRRRVVAGPLQDLKKLKKRTVFFFLRFWSRATTMQQPCNELATTLQRAHCKVVAGLFK